MDQEMREAFATLNVQLANIQNRFEAIDGRFEAIDGRFEAIDGRFEAIDETLQTHHSRFSVIEFKIDQLECKTDEGFALVSEQFERMYTLMDGIVGSYHRLDTEDVALRSRQDRLDARVSLLERKRT